MQALLRASPALLLLCPVEARQPRAGTAALEAISYRLRIPDPETQRLEVEASVPAAREWIELRMARWSPGFYRVEDYAAKLDSLTASSDGAALDVERTGANRWRVRARGAQRVVVSYRLLCDQRSVTTNWVSKDLGVLNGAPTFVTLADAELRPHRVTLELPQAWKRAMTALPAAPGGAPNDWLAPDFDTLVDSPIVAGALEVQEFEVEGTRHLLVDAGERGAWDARRAAVDLARMARAVRRFWGFLPFERYLFLNVFRPGGGGLEHRESTLLTANAARAATPEGYQRWLAFVAHEYFHAFNAERLRPVELGPFDYENAPRTPSLWVAEGFTSYYASLLLARAGLRSSEDVLKELSTQIERLQKQPGRLLRTLEQSSEEVWDNSLSGINPSEKTVSYYAKGEVVGFLLDARIRAATRGTRSLDDVMRLAYARYSGERGYTPQQFRAAAAEVAGTDLEAWFRRATASTEELDYTEALDWFGLRFAGTQGSEGAFRLEPRPDATEVQKSRLAEWTAGS